MIKEKFLEGVANWNNHLYLLWPALEATSGDIVEFGMGYGSTPILRKYATETARHLTSYESNIDWYGKFPYDHSGNHELVYISDWNNVNHKNIDVLLIDHAPGERRKIDLVKYANKAKIVILHDSEIAADHGYQCRQYFNKYKYFIDYKSEGAWATALSNEIDLTKWKI